MLMLLDPRRGLHLAYASCDGLYRLVVSCMLASRNPCTTSRPSNTAVGSVTGFSNLFGMLVCSFLLPH